MSKTLRMTKVDSDFLAAIGHDGEKLRIEFVDGKTFDYPGVPHGTFTRLLNAKSHGAFFNEYIKPKYKKFKEVK